MLKLRDTIHVKDKEVINEVVLEEEAVFNKKPAAVINDESYLETLDQEMTDLVSSSSTNWPLDWMKNKSEIIKLKRIMTKKKNCRRHELFMDSKQRSFRSSLPELIKTSNNSFMNIFGLMNTFYLSYKRSRSIIKVNTIVNLGFRKDYCKI